MKKYIVVYLLVLALLTGCSVQSQPEPIEATPTYAQSSVSLQSASPATKETKVPTRDTTKASGSNSTDEPTINGKYRKIEVDGGDTSGTRKPLVVVDIGFGSREYWAYTNEYGQLIRVTAKKIILQNPDTEPVLENGRYYTDEARVPGTERADLDQGHVIADSLGGVSNAYNITPQNSTLNRYGDQAYMEKTIRDAGGCTDFEAIITYPDTKTQIPSHYHYSYTINGHRITEDFDNVDPDEVNKALNKKSKAADEKVKTTDKETKTKEKTKSDQSAADIGKSLASVDKNNDGKVTIAEAKAAGFKMPITKDHWLYKYMDDRDGDGKVGE